MLRHVFGLYAEGAAVGRFVEIGALPGVISPESLELPLLAGEPRQDAALDVREVGHDELAALRRDNHAANAVRKHLRNVLVDEVSALRLDGLDRFLNFGRLHLPAGQVLRLKDAAGPSSGARCAHELQAPAEPSVSAHGLGELRVFLD